jgi:hypothetical protein
MTHCVTCVSLTLCVTVTVDPNQQATSPEFIWSTQTVAAGDTAVLHCSFDAIFSHLRIEGNEPTRVTLISIMKSQMYKLIVVSKTNLNNN